MTLSFNIPPQNYFWDFPEGVVWVCMYALFQLFKLKFPPCCHPVPISTVQVHKLTAAVCYHSCRGWCDALTVVSLVSPLVEAGASLCRNYFLWKAHTGDVIQVMYLVKAMFSEVTRGSPAHTPLVTPQPQKCCFVFPMYYRDFCKWQTLLIPGISLPLME